MNEIMIVKSKFYSTLYKVYSRGYEVVADWLRSGWQNGNWVT